MNPTPVLTPGVPADVDLSASALEDAAGLLIAALPISQVLKRTRELAALDQHLYQF